MTDPHAVTAATTMDALLRELRGNAHVAGCHQHDNRRRDYWERQADTSEAAIRAEHTRLTSLVAALQQERDEARDIATSIRAIGFGLFGDNGFEMWRRVAAPEPRAVPSPETTK